MKLLMLGRKIHARVEDDSLDVMCIWSTGLIHTYQGVTKPSLDELVPGFVLEGDSYGLYFDALKTIPIAMPKIEVCEIFGVEYEELQRLQKEEWVA